jgi:hypothetical protein
MAGLLSSGLTKVAGNILGSALGSSSPASSLFGQFGGGDAFTPTMLQFPSNVASDPAQGHYINFSIYESKPAKVSASSTAAKASKLSKAITGELFGGLGIEGTKARSFGDQNIVGLNAAANTNLKNLGRAEALGNKGINRENSLRLRRNATKRIGTNISLYMPPNISVSYNANYTDEPIGAVAEGALGVIDAFMQGGGEITEDNIRGAITAGMGAGTQAAKAAILGTINALAPGARALYAIESGQILTPRLELMFNGMGRRSFSYSFVFIPRDLKESQIVEEIVKQFKMNMAADYKEELGTIAGMRTMGLPNIFKIEYMYHGAKNTHLNEIGYCALQNVEVSYGSDRFVSYEGGYPQTTKLTLSFTEMDIITKSAIKLDGK